MNGKCKRARAKDEGSPVKVARREGPISGFVFIKAGISMYRVTKYYAAYPNRFREKKTGILTGSLLIPSGSL